MRYNISSYSVYRKRRHSEFKYLSFYIYTKIKSSQKDKSTKYTLMNLMLAIPILFTKTHNTVNGYINLQKPSLSDVCLNAIRNLTFTTCKFRRYN